MAKTRKPKEDPEEEIVKENIQKRFKTMFSGQGEPLSNMTIHEVEGLKARVSELEAALALQPTTEAGNPVSEKDNYVRPTSFVRISSSISNETKVNGGRRSFRAFIAGSAKKISTKIIISTLFIFSLVLTGFFLYMYFSTQADNRARVLDLSNQAEGAFNSKIQSLSDFALGLAVEAANNPEIQTAFASRDRQKLTDLTLASYLALDNEFGIPQYQYHLPPATSFLRLHSLDKYGDDLSSFRATVVQVNQTKEPVSGLEVGRGGLGLRGVVPVFLGSKHIGSVEFGLNIDQIMVNNLKQAYGNDWRISLTRDSLALATLEDISALQEGPTPDLLVLASTIDAVYPDAKTYNEVLLGEKQISAVTNSQKRSYSITTLPLRDYTGKIIGVVDIVMDQTALVQTQTNRYLLIILAAIVALGLGSYSLATTTNRNLRPLRALTKATEAIQQGDLTQRVEVVSEDEVGQLAYTFNTMTIQLQGLVEDLENRVVDRTHDLELASEVGRAVSENIRNLSEMLTAAVEMIRARFDLYYTQIYLVDPSEKNMILRAGTGDVGKELLQRSHYLPIDSASLNGRAAIEKRTVIVADTKDNPSFLPNPLLPKTRSEMSIPLMSGRKVIGVLDMQSEQPGALNETNLPAFEALAGQLAIAVENTALFVQAEEARTEVEAQIRRLTKQGWQDFLDAINRGQKIGFEFKKSQLVRLQPDALLPGSQEQGLSIPITVTGTKIGEIHLPTEQDRTWTPNELELIKVTSAQLAQHIENLRLLAQAERYRTEAEQALQRLTHEGWNSFLQTHTELESGYTFDLTEVKSLAEKSNGHFNHAVKQPMIVGDQLIGELAVDTPEQAEEAAELIAAVAEQLSGHIENLRLSELNERHAQREQTLRQITSALRSSNNPATIMRTAVRELGSIMGRRAIVQLASPQPADQAESAVSHENGSDATAPQS